MKEINTKKDLVKYALGLIDKWLDYQTFIKEIPGVAVGIFVEDEIVFKKEYGYADLVKRVKLTDKHLFRIASHSKLFTATAILKLYHEGKLSLDDKISKYLSWFSSEKDKNLEQIRIHHLLTHSSGISRDGFTAHWSTYQFPEIDAIEKEFREEMTFYQTSEILKYSNIGYTILGEIIQKVTGKVYHDFIEEIILEPFQMTNTVTDVNKSNIDKHATGYKIKFPGKERERIDHINAKSMAAATGLSSNVEDLIKFYKAHFLGNNALFPDYIKREMQRIQFKSKLTDWGLGFSIAPLSGSSLIGHGGGYPGFITRSGMIPENKIILVVLTNAIDGPAATLLTGIYKIIEYVIINKEKFELENEKTAIDFKEIIGFYESDWGISLFEQVNTKLVVINPTADNPVDTLKIYESKENLTFTAPNEPYNASPGELIEFVDDQKGQKIFIDSHRGRNYRFNYSY